MSRSLLAAVLSLVACLAGCAAADPDPGGGTGPDAGGSDDCIPDSCGAADCGQVPDGCGGVLSCGPCGNDCIPATCEPGMCGMLTDGCGGPLNCGDPCGAADCVDNACTCAADAAEPNDTTAKDLGTEGDCGDEVRNVTALSLGGNDVDKYLIHIVDDACLGNPKTGVAVDARDATTSFNVRIEFVCATSNLAITCSGGATLEGTNTCVGTVAPGTSGQFLMLQPDCSGGDEAGTATITIDNPAGLCESYALVYRVQ